MDTHQDTYDPDIDLLPSAAPAPAPTESLGEYQRLLANPLLTILIWVVTVAVIRAAVQSRNLFRFLSGVGLLLAAPLFLQFYCLDCGQISWLVRYRRHACPAVVSRWQSQHVQRCACRASRFSLPSGLSSLRLRRSWRFWLCCRGIDELKCSL